MDLSAAPHAQLSDAFARLQPLTHHAVLLDVAGHSDAASLCRRAAIGAGQPGARFAGLLADDTDPGERSLRERAAAESPTSLVLLWADAAARRRDAHRAEVFMLTREAAEPGTRAPLYLGTLGIQERSLATAAAAEIADRLVCGEPASRPPALRMLSLCAAAGIADISPLLRAPIELGDDSAAAAIALELVDLAIETPRLLATQSRRDYLHFLADGCTADRDAALFYLRNGLAELEQSVEEAIATTAVFGPDRNFDWRDALRLNAYLAALHDSSPGAASVIAEELAAGSEDPVISTIWDLRAWNLARRAGHSPDMVSRLGFELFESSRRLGDDDAALRSHAEDLAVGMCIALGDLGVVAPLLAADDSLEFRALAALLSTDIEALIAALIDTGIEGETLAYVATAQAEQSVDACRAAARIASASESQEQSLRWRELLLFIDLFTNHQDERVRSVAGALLERGIVSPPIIWAFWVASLQLGELPAALAHFARRLEGADDDTRRHLLAAIAESHAASGSRDEASEALTALEEADGAEWAARIRDRVLPRGEHGAAPATPAADVPVSDTAEDGDTPGEDGSQVPGSSEPDEAAPHTPVVPQAATEATAGPESQPGSDAAGGEESTEAIATQYLRRAEASVSAVQKAHFLALAGRTLEPDASQQDNATLCYEEALRLNPQSDEIKRFLKSILTANERWDRIVELGLAAQPVGELHSAQAVPAATPEVATAAPEGDDDAGHPHEMPAVPVRPASHHTAEGEAADAELDGTESAPADFESAFARAFDAGFTEEAMQPLTRLSAIDGIGELLDRRLAAAAETLEGEARASALWALWSHRRPQSDTEPELLKDAIAASERHLPSLKSLAGVYAELGQWDAHATRLEAAARLVADQQERANTYRQLGDVYLERLGNRSVALENYLVSFICAGDDAQTLARLEKIYTDLGRYKDLVSTYEVAIQKARASDSSALRIEDMLVEKARIERKHLNDPTRAANTIIQALAIEPTEQIFADLLVDTFADGVDEELIRDGIRSHLKAIDDEGAARIRNDPRFAKFLD